MSHETFNDPTSKRSERRKLGSFLLRRSTPLAVLSCVVVLAACDGGLTDGAGGSSGSDGIAGSARSGGGAAGSGGAGGRGGAAGAAGRGGDGLPQGNLFFDGFESGDFTATNQDDFSWTDGNKTSVVRDDQYVVNGETIVAGPIAGRRWEGFDGRHALRFRYPAGADIAEQRFTLGNAYNDIWVRYWLRVPINFEHPSSGGSNNKLAAFWMDHYEVNKNAEGATAVWQIRDDGSGGSNARIYYLESDDTGRSWSDRHSGELQTVPFISYPSDQGRWMSLVFHLVAATNESTPDGSLQMWRKWQGENEYSKIHELTNLNIPAPSSGPAGWSAGYLMGAANAPYTVDTEWLVDGFTVSTATLLQ